MIGGPGLNRDVRAYDSDVAVVVIVPRVRFGGEILALQPVHIGAGALLPRLAIQQSQRTPDDVAGRLADIPAGTPVPADVC